jgi:hypothetical protein
MGYVINPKPKTIPAAQGLLELMSSSRGKRNTCVRIHGWEWHAGLYHMLSPLSDGFSVAMSHSRQAAFRIITCADTCSAACRTSALQETPCVP